MLIIFLYVVLMPLSSHTFFTSTVAHPTPCIQAYFSDLLVMLLRCLIILSDVDFMHFVGFLLLHVKCLQLL